MTVATHVYKNIISYSSWINLES